MRRIEIAVPPVARVVPGSVFDDFGERVSSTLVVRVPSEGPAPASIGADNPPGFAFVFARPWPDLPRELATLHVGALAAAHEWALAPYAIDDATDGFHDAKTTPAGILELAARDVAGIYWGLHDWCHFHNHGPFTERAWTERQCDAAALAWIARNGDALGIDGAGLSAIEAGVRAIDAARFEAEGLATPPFGRTFSAWPASTAARGSRG